MSNKHISEYLKYYLELSSAPYYAVMLSGEWGCGKTWFINKLMDDFFKKKKEEEEKKKTDIKQKTDIFMYISLYGMKDTTEIDAAIFQTLHPILASKHMAITSSILRGVAKTGFNLNLDFKKDGNLNTLKKMISSNTNKIMIFDDLERCYIPHQELFGYLNGFVEHQGQKVILVSHERELFKEDNGNNTKKYKEKIIGVTFNVEADVNEAFKTFLKLVSNEHRQLLSKYQKAIFLVYEKVGKNNLRNLRQAIVSFPYFLKQLPDGMIGMLENRYKSSLDYQARNHKFENVVHLFFYLFLEEKSGTIDKENWEEAVRIFDSKGMSYADFLAKPDEEKEKIRESFSFLPVTHGGPFGLIHKGLFGSHWYDVVILNVNHSSKLEAIFEEMKEMKEMEKEASKAVWIILEGLDNLSKSTLKSKYIELLADIEKNKIANIGELFHSFGILLHLAKHKIIKKSIKSIKALIKKNLNKNIINGRYKPIHFRMYEWGGYWFWEHDSEEMERMLSYYRQLQEKVQNKELKKEFQELIKDLRTNVDVICKEIMYHGKFSYKPFFSYIKKRKQFFDEVFSLPVHKMLYFMSALKEERYMLRYSNGKIEEKFLPEIDMVNDFISYVEKNKVKTSPYLNPAIKKYDYLHNYLDEIKKQFEKTRVENEKSRMEKN